MANLRNALSTWIRPSTRVVSSPARRVSYQTVCRNSMRVWKSGLRFFKRSLMTPSQRRWARRFSVSANSGTGGALLAMAALSTERTESARGSSAWRPAHALPGATTRPRLPSPSAPALVNQSRRRKVPWSNLFTGRISPRSCADPALQEPQNLGHGHLGRRGIAAVLVLDLAFLDATVANRHAMRHTNEFPVGKHGARTLATIVQQHVHTGGQQLFVQLFGGGLHLGTADHADGADHQRERRDRIGPDDAALVVVLFNGSGRQARDANAVTTHFEVRGFAVFAKEGRVHGLAVFATEVEHMTHLDAAFNRQRTLSVGRGIAFDHIAQVGHLIGLGQVTPPVHARHV